jgi:O-antigen/teichoic acid export membrane protein
LKTLFISDSEREIAIAHFKRYFGYMFWAGLQVVVFVGLPRLIIFPVAAYLLGKEEFGLFIFLLGIAMIVGDAPSGGLAMGVIRHMAAFEKPTRDILVSTSVRLCKIAMLIIVAIGIIVLGVLRYFWQIDPKIIWCLVPLLIFLYVWNIYELQMVPYRVERKFALRAAWYSFLSVLLFIMIPAAMFMGVVGLAWGYMFGYLVTYIILSWRQRVLFKKSAYDIKLGALLKRAWFQLTLAKVLTLSSRYIYRIILGALHSFSSVTIFFGATSIIAVCTAPMNILSSLLFSILGGFTHLEDVGKKQRYIVLGAAVAITIGATLAVFFAGPFILSLMFPEFAEESAVILRLIVIIIPCSTVMWFSRPFIMKFGPVKFIPALSFITLVSHLLPAIILVPKFGIKGAAISYDIGYGLSAVSWLVALVWTFKFGSRSGTAAEEVPGVNAVGG